MGRKSREKKQRRHTEVFGGKLRGCPSVPVSIHDCPDDTYFRSSDVMPYVDEGGVLHLVDGEGTHRRWGTPNVSSYVTWLTREVFSVEVTGWHKHTVSPVGGTYYFVLEEGRFVRRRANAKTVKDAVAVAAKRERRRSKRREAKRAAQGGEVR